MRCFAACFGTWKHKNTIQVCGETPLKNQSSSPCHEIQEAVKLLTAKSLKEGEIVNPVSESVEQRRMRCTFIIGFVRVARIIATKTTAQKSQQYQTKLPQTFYNEKKFAKDRIPLPPDRTLPFVLSKECKSISNGYFRIWFFAILVYLSMSIRYNRLVRLEGIWHNDAMTIGPKCAGPAGIESQLEIFFGARKLVGL